MTLVDGARTWAAVFDDPDALATAGRAADEYADALVVSSTLTVAVSTSFFERVEAV